MGYALILKCLWGVDMSNFTAALEVIGTPYHVTLCFCPTVKAGKFRTTNCTDKAKILSVQYWERVNLTVMVLESDLINARHEYYKKLGYTYAYEFIPHATIGSGDLVSENTSIIGSTLEVGNEYARIY